MLNKLVLTLAATLMILASLPNLALGQQIPLDQTRRVHRWDGTHGIVCFGFGAFSKPGSPMRCYEDGKQRGTEIDIFKDFPDLKRVVIEDASALVGGKVVIAAVLNFGSNLRHVLLTYDLAGKILEVWDTEPYYVQAVTTSDSAEVFVLAQRLDDDGKPYPLFIGYNSTGAIISKGLISSTFLHGSRAVQTKAGIGNPTLMLQHGKFFLFSPVENEILVFLRDGTVVKRMQLDSVLRKLGKIDHVEKLDVNKVFFLDDSRITVEVTEMQKAGPTRSQVLVDLGSMEPKKLSDGLPSGMLIGAKSGKLIILSASADNRTYEPHYVSAQ